MLPIKEQPVLVVTPQSSQAMADVKRIGAMTDAVIRNLQITACYCQLSAAFAVRTGIVANWCTFATWASRQAGQTIRGEDLQRTIEAIVRSDPKIREILASIEASSKKLGKGPAHEQLHNMALDQLIQSAVKRASDAVARGNNKVFMEIGYEFARFIADCLNDEIYNPETIAGFCKDLPPRILGEDEDYLCKAFTRYYESFFEHDQVKRDQMLLLANLEIGFHEQIRLQPDILESLNSGLVDPQHVRKLLLNILTDSKSFWGKIVFAFKLLIGIGVLWKKEIDALVLGVQEKTREVITKYLMTLTIPPDNCLHLGEDLKGEFPITLRQLQNAELLALIARVKPRPDELSGDGAEDWSDLNQRMHFIADLFRYYHQTEALFNNAFTAAEMIAIEAGKKPEGLL